MSALTRRTLLILWPLLLITAVGVVYTTHLCRQLYTELSALQQEESRLQVEWGQYLLEQSAWASLSRIESTAATQLGMRVPDFNDMIMVEP